MRSAADARGRRSAPASGASRLPCADDGVAVVDFALVSGLLTLLFAGVLQVTLALHVRNTLIDCAAEGARYAAFADRGPQDGAERTATLIAASLSPRFAEDVVASETWLNGLPVIEVRVTAPLPVAGLLGPSGVLSVVGHALEEAP